MGDFGFAQPERFHQPVEGGILRAAEVVEIDDVGEGFDRAA